MEWIFLLILLCIYFIPSIVASQREKKDKTAIVVVNIFLGWTLIGWVVALAWACMEDTLEIPTIPPVKAGAVSRLQELERMLKSGTITEQEFMALKSKLIGER